MSRYKISVSIGTTTISAIVIDSTVTTIVTNHVVQYPPDGPVTNREAPHQPGGLGDVLYARGREAVLQILYQLRTVLGRVYGFLMQEIALYGFAPHDALTFEGGVPFPRLSLKITQAPYTQAI
jgi:hypothetical protein